MRYHWNQRGRGNEHPILFSLTKYLTINLLLPIAKRTGAVGILEQRARKRANVALLIFYGALILGLISSVFSV